MKNGKITGATLTSLVCLYLSSAEVAASAVNNIDADSVITDTQSAYTKDCNYAVTTEVTSLKKTKKEDAIQYHHVNVQDSEGAPEWIRTNFKVGKQVDGVTALNDEMSVDTNENIDNENADCVPETLVSSNEPQNTKFICDDSRVSETNSNNIGISNKERNKAEFQYDELGNIIGYEGLQDNVIVAEDGKLVMSAKQLAQEKWMKSSTTQATAVKVEETSDIEDSSIGFQKDNGYFGEDDNNKKTISLSDADTLIKNAEAEMTGYLNRHIGVSALRLLVFKLKWHNQYSYDEKLDRLIGYGAAINKSNLSKTTKHELIDMMCNMFDGDDDEAEVLADLSSINEIGDVPRVYVSKLILQDADQMLVENPHMEEILSKYKKKRMSMEDFNKAISEINAFLRAEGYPAATCYLPEQENTNNEVIIIVEFGRLGNLILENESSLNDGFINSLLSDVKIGEIVHARNLETAIYNINELGGVQAAGFFRPGEKTGETDIIVRVKDTKQDNYAITTDNYGSVNSGRYHYNLVGEWINRFGNGERIALNASTSDRKQRNYGLTYEQVVAKNGTKASFNISNSDYELGSWYSSMGVTGRATNYGIGFTTPLWKTGTSRMGMNYGFIHRSLTDEMRAVDYVVKKHSDSAYFGINGSELIGKAAINYDFTATAGRMTCDDAHIMGFPLRLASEGFFTKGVLGLYGRYSFDSRFDFSIGGRVQRASNLLDSSEQFFLGGARGVRAYPQGEGAGDEGYLVTGELTYHTGIKGLDISMFYDTGHVDYVKDHSVLGGIYLSGWGLGLTYRNDNCWARIDYARRIGLDEHASKDAEAKDRIWFTAGIRF